jgi:hypothetical protein
MADGRLNALSERLPRLDLLTLSADITDKEAAQCVVAATQGRIHAWLNLVGGVDGFQPAY